MTLLTTTDACAAFCRKLAQEPFITIDTEFMRERTYYSKLCLIQLGGQDEAAAIDPLAEGIDLTPLFELLQNKKVLKVFHAARQDVEIFVNLTGKVPEPLYDTQIAAMVCGFGDSVGYETLATSLTRAKIDKTSRFTDWARRPLTDKQIAYALADVTHLRLVYEKLSAQIKKAKRENWLQEEMDILTDVRTYQYDPMEVWQRLKTRPMKPKNRAVLREVAAWREREAQATNVPRGRVLKDEQLLEIAAHEPQTIEALSQMRGLSQGFAQGRLGASLLEAVVRGVKTPIKDCPPEDQKKKVNINGSRAIVELLRVLLHHVSEKHDVAPKLLASSDDLDLLATEDNPDIKAMTGWRREIFGDPALEFKQGKLGFVLKNGKIAVTKV